MKTRKLNVEKEEQEVTLRKDKPLHSMYHQLMEEMANINKLYQWPEEGGLKERAETLIMGTQEQ